MKEVVSNKPLFSQSSDYNEKISLIEAVKAYSMLTNCTVLLYDCLYQKLSFANVSNAAIESHQTLDGLQEHLGDGMQQLKRVCQQKIRFLRRIEDVSKRKMVLSGSLHISAYNPAINRVDEVCAYFLGVPLAFTSSGDLHYELFKIFFGRGVDRDVEIFNGETGERWRRSPVQNKWVKMPRLVFSDLEKQVISLSVIGLSAKEIAERVYKSEVAVKKAKARIMEAVGASTMTEAAFLLSHYKFL